MENTKTKCEECGSEMQLVDGTPDEREHLECRNMDCNYTTEVAK